jgi:hypothetical protein
LQGVQNRKAKHWLVEQRTNEFSGNGNRRGATVTLPRVATAVLAFLLLLALGVWVRSGQLPEQGGIFIAFGLFWLLSAVFAVATVPKAAWTHATALASVLLGWPLAFATAYGDAIGCGGAFPLDLIETIVVDVPFLALIAPQWTPIPPLSIVVVAALSAAFERSTTRPLPWWTVAVALASIPAVEVLSALALRLHGVEPLNRPCFTM